MSVGLDDEARGHKLAEPLSLPADWLNAARVWEPDESIRRHGQIVAALSVRIGDVVDEAF